MLQVETIVARSLPSSVFRIVNAREPAARERAWSEFSREYSKLILHTCHKNAAGHDDAMDRYAYVLEQLRADGCRRLGTYDSGRNVRFSTWLVAVVCRMCTDFHRKKYGRVRNEPHENVGELNKHGIRARIVDLVTEELDLERLADSRLGNPERELTERELTGDVAEAVAKLDDRDRVLLALRFEDEQTAGDIAAAMNFKSQFHVYRRLTTVLSELRRALEEKGYSGTG